MPSFERAGSIRELRSIARRRLPRAVFDFIDGAAETETTLRANESDLADLRFVPRYPVDVSSRVLETRLLGERVEMPMFISPTGLSALATPKADLALARAAGAQGIPFCISTSSSVRLEEIAAGAPDTSLWFQIYMYREKEIVRSLIDRCARSGIGTLVVTVDLAVPGHRARDHANRFTVPLRPTPRLAWDVVACLPWTLGILRNGAPRMMNLVDYGQGKDLQSLASLMTSIMDPSVSWGSLGWMRDNWPGKLLIKGILAPEDAAEAVARGYDGVIVSNHGGRQLDGAISSISALPRICAEAGGKIDVLVDGGIRSGGDVAKAVALGATAAGVGRATLFAAAAGGAPAVLHALDIFRRELDRTLALLGCPSIADLDRRFLHAPAG